jgi:GNAT superfamily N-acetyltransferase
VLMDGSLGSMRRNMRAFYRLLGTRSPGGALIERDGLVAAIVPSCPDQSIVNGVVYEAPAAIEACRDELEAAYGRAGVRRWRVWVPEADREIGDWLKQCGHRLSGSPRAMKCELGDVDVDVADGLDWDVTADVASVARLNEDAYGLPPGEFADALTALTGDAVRVYLAREHGEAAACVVAIDEDADCGMYAVATRPASRRRGLASTLMRRALIDARDRGCTTSTLQSSQAGAGVYARLGYQDLGGFGTWERTL